MNALTANLESAPPEARDGYVLAAAVMDTFEPAKLTPVKGFEGNMGTLLDVSVMSEKPDGAIEWRLPNTLRRAALKVLVGQEGLSGMREANREGADKDSPYQRAFEGLLSGEKVRPEDQNLEQLQASLNAVKVLEGIVPSLPNADAIRSHLIQRDYVRQFEILAGGNFVGRQEQLTQLRRFVDVLPESLGDLLRRSAVGLLGRVGVHRFLREAPLMITGMGGMGKSALLSKFMLEHLHGAVKSPDLLIAYVDFDKPGIWPDQPLTMLAEIVQQLALQVPKEAAGFRALHGRIVEALAVTGSDESDYDSAEAINNAPTHGQTLMDRSLQDFGTLCNAALNDTTRKTLLLVLDTFEEVSQRSRVHQENVLRLVGQLQHILPRLRVVISGRGMHIDAGLNADMDGAPPAMPLQFTGIVDELARTVKPLELPELSPAEAATLLESLGSLNERLNAAIVERVGGHPLSLKLAAQLVRTVATKLKEAPENLTAVDLFGPVWTVHMSESLLYRRIISHIPDEPLQKLADPGLVLRELNSGIIFHVLNEPCALGLKKSSEADGLFERLKEYNQLVSIQSAQVVRHRPELRQRVLNEMIHAKLPLCREIWSRAARYHQEKGESRTEELYCLLMLDEPASVLANRWQSGLEKGLLRSRGELPENARHFLDLMALRMEGNTGRAFDGDLDFLLLAEEMKLLLSRGDAKGAIDLFKASTAGKLPPFDSALYVVHARAIAQSGDLDTAFAMAWRALLRVEKELGTADVRYEELLLLCCQVTRSQRLAWAGSLLRLINKTLERLLLDWDGLFSKFQMLDFYSPRTTNILRLAVEMLELVGIDPLPLTEPSKKVALFCSGHALDMLRQMTPHYFGVDGALLVRSFAELSDFYASLPEVRHLLEVPQVKAVLDRDYSEVLRAHPDAGKGGNEARAMGATLRLAIRARDRGQD